MTEWTAFAGFAGVVLGLLLLLAHASKAVFSDADDQRRRRRASFDVERPLKRRVENRREDSSHGRTTADGGVDANAHRRWEALDRPHGRRQSGIDEMSTASLLVNVAVSQGLFGVLLVVGVWFTEIPLSALGLGSGDVSPLMLAVGAALGVGLYVVNELGAAAGERVGIASSEELRQALAPDSAAGWAVLLLIVLPVIAGFEELLFRAALVGVVSAGFGVSPWLLAVLSSVAFALGHGAQGPGGIVVTGTLGFVLAAAFVLTGSFLVVFVAHYLVNALEFVVHEGLDVDWV
jgi:membrane protease YdiL (CAAX protease family)